MEGLKEIFIIGGMGYLMGLLIGYCVCTSAWSIVVTMLAYGLAVFVILKIKQRRQSRREP